MTKKEFIRRLTRGKIDILEVLFDLLRKEEVDYCVIGGLAVNVYVEPVVSLDLDLVVVLDSLPKVRGLLKKKGFKIEEFRHSINLEHPDSDLRIQLQTDQRYQAFIQHSSDKDVLGYPMKVAALEDVLQGKTWACLDRERRPSKRQKDLADIFRLAEAFPRLKKLLPAELQDKLSIE